MPVIPFEVDSISDFVAKPHSKNLAPLNQNKQQKKPDQLTLVPDPPEALTSSFGWDLEQHRSFLIILIFHILK